MSQCLRNGPDADGILPSQGIRMKKSTAASDPQGLATPEECLKIVRNDGRALKRVPEHLKSAELCSLAVQENCHALEYVPEALRTPELCLAAVQRAGALLAFVPEERKTPEICRAALQDCFLALQHVPGGGAFAELRLRYAGIKVVGVGSGGIKAVNHMIASGLQGMLFIAADTCASSLAESRAEHTILLGPASCQGKGTAGDSAAGRRAAEESLPAIRAAIGEACLVLIVAGMGGGTGGGAAPVIAEAARAAGAFVFGATTMPFHFEGGKRLAAAEGGMRAFTDASDSLVIIPGDRLDQLGWGKGDFSEILHGADEALLRAVSGATDVLVHPGLIGVDFADFCTTLKGKGAVAVGFGAASGESRAHEAAMQAVCSPLLAGVAVERAFGMWISIVSNDDIMIEEVAEIATIFQTEASEDARIFFGARFDNAVGGELRVTVLVTQATVLESLQSGSAPSAACVEGEQFDEGDFVFDEEEFEVPTFIRRNRD